MAEENRVHNPSSWLGNGTDYIHTAYICKCCESTLYYEKYGEIASTLIYCLECGWQAKLTKDGKKSDVSLLSKRI